MTGKWTPQHNHTKKQQIVNSLVQTYTLIRCRLLAGYPSCDWTSGQPDRKTDRRTKWRTDGRPPRRGLGRREVVSPGDRLTGEACWKNDPANEKANMSIRRHTRIFYLQFEVEYLMDFFFLAAVLRLMFKSQMSASTFQDLMTPGVC